MDLSAKSEIQELRIVGPVLDLSENTTAATPIRCQIRGFKSMFNPVLADLIGGRVQYHYNYPAEEARMAALAGCHLPHSYGIHPVFFHHHTRFAEHMTGPNALVGAKRAYSLAWQEKYPKYGLP